MLNIMGGGFYIISCIHSVMNGVHQYVEATRGLLLLLAGMRDARHWSSFGLSQNHPNQPAKPD